MQPSDENYEENRILFTRLKSMQLYALQFELLAKWKFLKKLDGYVFFAIGPGIIDTETERLTQGFTFIENIGVGLSYSISEQLLFDIKPSYNHISNAQIQLSNSGYNSLNIEVGLSLRL